MGDSGALEWHRKSPAMAGKMVKHKQPREQPVLPSPMVIIDDGQWLCLYRTAEELVGDLEWPHLADVIHAFDGQARPLRLFAEEEKVCVEVAGREPALPELQRAVDSFFVAWTHDAPPAHTGEVGDYMRSVEQSYAARRERRRKRR